MLCEIYSLYFVIYYIQVHSNILLHFESTHINPTGLLVYRVVGFVAWSPKEFLNATTSCYIWAFRQVPRLFMRNCRYHIVLFRILSNYFHLLPLEQFSRVSSLACYRIGLLRYAFFTLCARFNYYS